jgi:pentatricopeptide repeat protein
MPLKSLKIPSHDELKLIIDPNTAISKLHNRCSIKWRKGKFFHRLRFWLLWWGFMIREVNSHVLSWIVIHYAKSKMTHDAVQVFEQMSLCNLKPHLHACTVLINSLLKDGVTSMVWKVYKRMIQDGVVPNIYLCL